MATTEEIQKLIMQVEGERELSKLVAQQTDAEKLMRKLVDRFNEGKISQQEYARQTEIVASSILRLRERTEQVEKSLGKMGGSFAKYGQEMRTLGYVTQDFAQGGFGAILNNIDGLLYKFPMLAGAATIAATAIWAFGPPLKEMVKGIVEGSNKIPEATDKLEKLSEAVKKNSDRLNELKGKQSLTNAELAEFNRLTAESTKLEKEADEERTKRQAAAAARSQKTDVETSIGTAFSAVSGGANFDKMAANVAGLSDYEKARVEFARLEEKRAKGELTPDDINRRSGLAKWLNANAPGLGKGGSPEDVKAMMARVDEAENLIGKARGGDEAAFDAILGKATGDLKDQLNAIDPRQAGKRAFNQEEAKRQIGEAIKGALSPIISELRENREKDAAARQWTIDAAAFMDGARKGQLDMDREAKRRADQKEREKLAGEREAAREAAEAPARARAAQLAEIRDRLNYDTGGQFPEAVLMDAAKSTQDLMSRGVNPMMAAQMALADVIQANEQLMQRMRQLEAGFDQLRMRNSRMMGGQMAGGGFSGLPMYQGGL